jgi:hypothetical protein
MITHLTKRLEEKYPLEKSDGDAQEGINIWKEKRIIPTYQWLKMTASLKNDNVIFDISKGFNHFPDSTCEIIFRYNSDGPNECLKELLKEEFDKWFNDYIDLLIFRRDSLLGQAVCKNCLLDKTKDESGLKIGIHKMIAKVLQKELSVNPISKNSFNDNNHNSRNSEENIQIYPCKISNFFPVLTSAKME